MWFLNLVDNLAQGAIGSLIATCIWVILSRYYGAPLPFSRPKAPTLSGQIVHIVESTEINYISDNNGDPVRAARPLLISFSIIKDIPRLVIFLRTPGGQSVINIMVAILLGVVILGIYNFSVAIVIVGIIGATLLFRISFIMSKTIYYNSFGNIAILVSDDIVLDVARYIVAHITKGELKNAYAECV